MSIPCHAVSLLVLAAGLLAPGAQNAPEPDPYAVVEDVPELPRVLVIGDSISVGYTVPLRKLLKGEANVHRVPTNAESTRHSLGLMDDWLCAAKWDVIHFNWGAHDYKIMENGKHQVSVEEYEQNLEILVARLKKTGGALIWATCTPVPHDKVRPPRRPEDVVRYNEVARKVMLRHGVAINDLYRAVLPHLGSLQIPNNVHFKPEGYQFLAERVARHIAAALKSR